MVTRDEELKWAYLLDPCFELTNSAGKPLTDGYLEVYIAGTRNKYYCASDFAGTLHPFQIPLDSLGSNIVLADPDNAYDVYVYNRFGSLVMSRYNVTPADGGVVISNTERINELEELVVSAVTGLQGQIDDINEALDDKKDKQEEYTVTLTPSQTVSAIIQDENGQLQVITQEIALPDSVPNVNIVSPTSTLTVSSVYDPVTNTNTFNIDISDTGTLEYGQYMSTSDITTGAVLTRIKGNLNTTLDGKIKLTGGKSYHITVRGTYVTGEAENTVEPLQYVEYVSNSRIKVDVDNTVTEEQHFELSYDLFKLAADTDYYVSFLPSSGKVTELTVEVHSLSNFNAIGQGGSTYEQGWGIIIDNDEISVDPTILEQYTTTEEVTEIVSSVSTVLQNEIDNITGGVQADWEQDDPSEPDYIKNKPDLDIYATNDMVTSVSSTLVEMIDEVSGNIPELPEEEAVEFQEINLDDYALASAIPDLSGYAETSDVIDMVSAVSTVLQDEIDNIPAQVQSDWEESDTESPAYIQNKPDLSVYAETSDVIDMVSAVSTVLHNEIDNIPVQVQSDWDESDTESPAYILNKPNLDDYATDIELEQAVTAVTALIPEAQVQSDWTESDDTKKSYIQHKPEVKDIYAGPNIILTDTASGLEISAIGGTQIQSDWTQTDDTQKDYIKHKPTPKTLVAGQNITITDTVTGLEISSTGGGAAQVNSDWNAVSGVAEILNKPEEVNLIAGQNISIAVTGASAIISSIGGGGGGTTYTAGTGIDITNDVISINSDVALASAIPDVSNLATKTELATVEAEIPELPDEEEVEFTELDLGDYALASAIPSIELNSDSQVTSIDGHALAGGGSGTTYTAGDYISIDTNDVISVTGLDNSNIFWATYNVTTYNEITDAIAAGKKIFLQKDNTILPLYGKSGNQYRFATGIAPNFTNSYPGYYYYYVTTDGWLGGMLVAQSDWNQTNNSLPSYIWNKPSIPQIELNGNDQVTGIDGHELAGGGGSSYTPGTGIDITNDVISVNADVALASAIPELPDDEEVEFTELDLSDYAPVSAIPDTSDMATKTWVGNQGYLTSVPANYVTDTELNNAVSGFATKSEVTTGLNGKQNTLTGITDVQVVQSLPASPVATVLYLIPEA